MATKLKNICIQGYEGSFHHIVAKKLYKNNFQIIPCKTFTELIHKSELPENDGGIMAIENSNAGSILPNFSLLLKSSLRIVGELYLPLHQNLLILPQSKEQDIKEVHSHPMALLQCADFLQTKPHWKLVETEDTALSAKILAQKKSKHIAVIAGNYAAELFNLKILYPKIENIKPNITRFLVLKKTDINFKNVNKISLFFITKHQQGALSNILQIIAKEKINLSKIQSIAIPKKPFHYGFYIDIEFVKLTQFHQAFAKICLMIEEIKILGAYKKHVYKL